MASPAAPPETEFTYKFAEEIHQYIREYIRLADQKAGFIFTASVALLALLYQKGVFKNWLRLPNQWHLADVFALLAVLALSLAAFTSICVVVPRLKGSPRGYIYWNSIAAYESGDKYAEAIIDLTKPELAGSKLKHCYELAKVCRSKYIMLKRSFWAGLLGLVFIIPLLFVL